MDVLDVGLWLTTFPAATLALFWFVTAPTLSPAPVIAVDAALWVIPTTFGTAICGGPVETTRFTEEPCCTAVPA
jgi:hypothetical protein